MRISIATANKVEFDIDKKEEMNNVFVLVRCVHVLSAVTSLIILYPIGKICHT